MKYILSLIQGTSSSRAVLFDKDGDVAAASMMDVEQRFPKPGWIEADADEIWYSIRHVSEQVLHEAGARSSDIAAIGICNQRGTVVLWDRDTGDSVGPALSWQDMRSHEICSKLREKEKTIELARSHAGLIIDPSFAAPKIHWMLENNEQAKKLLDSGRLLAGTVDSWILWNLTGGAVHATDASNASMTLLYNLQTRQWDPSLLALFGIPAEILPSVRNSSHVFGRVTSISDLEGVTIAGLSGDQNASLFGQACFSPGNSKFSYGTGCFFLSQAGETLPQTRNPFLTTVAWQLDEKPSYAIEGNVLTGGAMIDWLQEGLGIIDHPSEIESIAEQVRDSGGVYFVPAFSRFGAADWETGARGLLIGFSRATRRGHVARAALESIAFQCASVVRDFEEMTGTTIRELRVDGSAAENDLLMQFQADLLGIPLKRSDVTETSGLGAAMFASRQCGWWSSLDELRSKWHTGHRFERDCDGAEIEQRLKNWNLAVERARSWTRID